MIASLMVHVCFTSLAAGHVEAAANAAERLSARLIGVAAGHPPAALSAEAGGLPAAVYQQLFDDTRRDIEGLETEFRKAASRLPAKRVEWRGAMRPPHIYVPAQLRAADLAVVSARAGEEGAATALDVSDLLMTAGRPVIVMPPEAKSLETGRILIAWKNAAQARRAVRDAIDLLAGASHVVLCGAGEEASEHSLADVAAYLALHRIEATVLHEKKNGPAGDVIRQAAAREKADLIVAGAYGHSRMREWALGGVTRNLLANSTIPCLFSH